MAKYFGTDGIRGKANDFLTNEIAYKVGRYLGFHYNKLEKGRVLIGRDTRISGTMLESALTAGFSASGCDVDLVGVIPTPGLAMLIKEYGYAGGIMITASHNPYHDNGLKVLDAEGSKIDYFLQQEIESYINDDFEIPLAIHENIGVAHDRHDLLEVYLGYIRIILNMDLTGMSIAVDAANGSASHTVEILKEMGAAVTVIGNTPNGININDRCGSTYIDNLQHVMREGDYDFGFALDGDADRVIIVDDHNEVVDGDLIIYLAAKYFKGRGLLHENTVVFTKMSNLGLCKALDAQDIDYVITDVGDANVHDKMSQEGYVVGGEQSGHIILTHLSSMSDGLITALLMIKVCQEKGKSLSELSSHFKRYPQMLKNVETDKAKEIMENEEFLAAIDRVTKELGDEGRVFIRPSGTEPLIRVMIEAQDQETCDKYMNYFIDYIHELV